MSIPLEGEEILFIWVTKALKQGIQCPWFRDREIERQRGKDRETDTDRETETKRKSE